MAVSVIIRDFKYFRASHKSMVENTRTNEEGRELPIQIPQIDIEQVRRNSMQALSAESADIATWRHGAEQYRKFLEAIPKDLKERYERDHNLQLVFLGEKPAIWSTQERYEKVKNELEQFGLLTEGEYLFSPAAVKVLLEEYPNEFTGLPTESPAELMKTMAGAKETENLVARGLLLGYPLISCKEHAIYLSVSHIIDSIVEELGGDTHDGRELLNACGIKGFVGDSPDKLGEDIGRDEARAILFSYFSRFSQEMHIDIDDSSFRDAVELFLNGQSKEAGPQMYRGWMEYSGSSESKQKENRIRQAFEFSGLSPPSEII